MHTKKFVAVLSAVALSATLVSCGGKDDDQAGGNYVSVNGSEPQNPLVPANTNENGGGRIIDTLFSGLVYYDNNGETKNDLAESITPKGDRAFEIKIRPDAKFSDGSQVKAKNFVDAWNYAVEKSQLDASFFEPIEGYKEGQKLSGLKVDDDTTFTVTLSQPLGEFPNRLGHPAFAPLPDSAFTNMDGFGENPAGSGPYKLKEWNHNQNALVVPNENYNGPRKPKNEGVNFVFYPKLDAAYADLLSGNLDVLDNIPDSALANYKQELGDRSINKPVAGSQGFIIPGQADHFKGEEGKLRRQAISMAVDRPEIIKAIFQGTRTPATDFTAPVIPGHSDNLKGGEVLQYNPQKAKELWAKADAMSPWSGKFAIAYNSDGGHQAWVDATVNAIRNNLGIEAEGNPYPDFKSLRTDVTKRQIKTGFRSGWQGDYPALSNFLEPLYATKASSNDGDYSNPQVDELLEKASSTTNQDESRKLYNQVQEILMTDLPFIPLWNSNAVSGYSDKVADVTIDWKGEPAYDQITKK